MFPLGMLVFKSGSGFVPKALGVFLMIGCCGYLINFLAVYLPLNMGVITSLWMSITIFSEVLCILWLLINGPKDQNPVSIIASV
jgi:hypothetical protein